MFAFAFKSHYNWIDDRMVKLEDDDDHMMMAMMMFYEEDERQRLCVMCAAIKAVYGTLVVVKVIPC